MRSTIRGLERVARGALFTWILALLPGVAHGQSPAGSFFHFESGHVQPLALSADGNRLYAVNTPDSRLAIYDITNEGLSLAGEVPVGLEPVSIAARGNDEVWVVNFLSDSISVVEVDTSNPELSRVVRTLHTCDEPRGLVFGGPGQSRAFVATARRGQNCPVPFDPTVEGIGRAVVQVFDVDNLGAALGGTPQANVVLFGDTPRALAVSSDGSRVYAAIFHSGNQTMTIPEVVVTGNASLPPPPSSLLPGGPPTGLIVRYDGVAWRDEIGRDWSPAVPFSLPDLDVFVINAMASPPTAIPGQEVSGVATSIFNLAVHPGNGKVYASNTEDHNEVRFEGITFDGVHGVRGRQVESSISIIDGLSSVRHHLNPHIDYSISPGPESEIELSSAFPTDMVFSSDGADLYVAALGSRHIVALKSATLESGSVVKRLIPVGGGPSGVALDEARDRLYVLNRFQNEIGIVTNVSQPLLAAQTSTIAVGDYDPQPAEIRQGRRHLYNARRSGHGDQACHGCHHFGDQDDKAWDLGDAAATAIAEVNCNPFRSGSGSPFHPAKGPMTTQSLRGMDNMGPMHWRGDRTGCHDGGDALDEEAAFKAFNGAFVGLLGDDEELSEVHMQEFTDFILPLRYPPGPIVALDEVLTSEQAAGEDFYFNINVDGGRPCNGCHVLDEAQGFFGTDGLSSTEGEPQEFKIAHLRDQYRKVGMHGVPGGQSLVPPSGFLGDQVRGFGFLHDGALATVNDFLSAPVFNFPTPEDRRNVEAFVLGFDTGLKPVVGQQVSLNATSASDPATLARLQLLMDQAEAGNCDLIGKGVLNGERRGALYAGNDQFRTDRASDGLVGLVAILNIPTTPGQESLVTCVPPGMGERSALDRDGDGNFDRDEIDAGTDPHDPTHFPGSVPTVTISTRVLKLKDRTNPPTPSKRKLTFTSKDPAIVVPAVGSIGDPTVHGALLRVYNAAGGGEQATVSLPAGRWQRVSSGYRFRGSSQDPVQSISTRNGLLKIKAGRDAWGFTLDEPKQGRITVRLRMGTGVDWCAPVAGRVRGTPPSSDRYDKVDSFQGEKNAPAPAGCPVPPVAFPSEAFLDR